MQAYTQTRRDTSRFSDSALLKNAMEAVEQIEAEAKQKKMVQLQSLKAARAGIEKRLGELNHQVAQIDAAIESIHGSPTARRGKAVRRNWDTERERVIQWLVDHNAQKFRAGDLIREFPSLEGVVFSVLLKQPIQDGRVKMDTSEGSRRPKYYVTE